MSSQTFEHHNMRDFFNHKTRVFQKCEPTSTITKKVGMVDSTAIWQSESAPNESWDYNNYTYQFALHREICYGAM